MKVALVKLKSVFSISEKAVLCQSWDGSEDIFPKSTVVDEDYNGGYWIACWILPKKSIQYSLKRIAWWDGKRVRPFIEVVRHMPEKKKPHKQEADESLTR